MNKLIGCLFLVAACGGGGGSNNDMMGDDMPMIDAPPAPLMITISGTATSRGLNGATPVDAATIAAYTNADETTVIGMTTTAADGTFTLTITTTGTAVTGFLKGTKSGFKTSYLYTPTPISMNLASVPMNMLTTTNYDALSNLAGGQQMPQNGLVAQIVLSGADYMSMPVMGATVTSSPASGRYRYNGSNGLPSSTATSTAADGIAYAFNAPPGAITMTASKTGSTFKPTMLNVHADALTQTLITP